jgi:hypothetical protein
MGLLHSSKELLLVRFAPRNQIARNSTVIAADTGFNSQFTPADRIFAASGTSHKTLLPSLPNM